MNEMDNQETVDAEDIFGLDFTSGNPEGSVHKVPTAVVKKAKEKVKQVDQSNPYEGVEDVLGLPRGSTKEGLAEAKKEVKRITDEAKNLRTQAQILQTKERMSDVEEDIGIPQFNMETLANDRRILRDNYMSLYKRGMAMLERIENDLNDLVNPEPDDYANYQRQYLAMLKTLDSIRTTLVTLRDEEDRYAQKVGTSGESAGGVSGTVTAAVDENGNPVTTAPGVELAPHDTNSWIAQWTAELDEEMAAEIQREFDERNAPKALEDQTDEGQ